MRLDGGQRSEGNKIETEQKPGREVRGQKRASWRESRSHGWMNVRVGRGQDGRSEVKRGQA
jgi:hypothetical protein